jgi:L-asparaginase II
MVESRHEVSVAVVNAQGAVRLQHGEIDLPVYPRSAIKPLQALPLIETGAADRYGLRPAEIALACASHNGEPRHVAAVRAWLDRIGCTVDDLECGSHMPYHEASHEALVRTRERPTAAHNNCSGKHAGFLSTARHLREPTSGYIRPDHPVQRRILRALEEMCGLSLGSAPAGIDGCGIPVIAVPLRNLALAMARLADAHGLPAARAAAAGRILAGMAAEPFMVAGSGRFCTEVIAKSRGRALVKTGAEGVFCVALPAQGLGLALKVRDGAGRAAEVATGHLLQKLGALDDTAVSQLGRLLRPPVLNRASVEVGEIRIGRGAAG